MQKFVSKMNDPKINNLLSNLQLSEKYLTRIQKEVIKDIAALYRIKGFLNEEQMATLENLWRVSIMSGGEVDD